MSQKLDSKEYLEKKKYFENIITIYGRKPVLEAFEKNNISIDKLHLAKTNKQDKTLDLIIKLAKQQNTEITFHSKSELSRISKNGKQDQGIAADIYCQFLNNIESLDPSKEKYLLALDQITNPQNIGMIIRSVTAGNLDGIILPKDGTSPINSLVIKSSAGTVFKAKIFQCKNLLNHTNDLTKKGYQLATLTTSANQNLLTSEINHPTIFILGNESKGVSQKLQDSCQQEFFIPMQNDVESLNVAVTAGIISYLPSLRK
ncbi:MAG: 23S rRNA (guanosine(2251)-2'-O)-methyltransferase RlmB [Planctomycetota bacterium]|nr:MAG: 23S rRNA (guanosine(2251)-2'-O)-methyltransferase RlmB [Planctomycetota bacterium]